MAAPANADFWDWATGPSMYDVDGQRDWGVEIVPYLWLANLNGDISLPPVGTIPIGATFSNLASNLDAGFAGVMDAKFRRWHLLVDGSWVRVTDTVSPPQPLFDSANVESSVAFGLAGIAYELPLDLPVSIEPYLGARWWHVQASAIIATAGPGPLVSGGATEVWADVIVGTRIRYRITEKWRVGLTADIGGGGSRLDWQALGYVGYMFNPHVGLTAGYRVLGVDYSNGGFGYDVRQNGLVLGLGLAY